MPQSTFSNVDCLQQTAEKVKFPSMKQAFKKTFQANHQQPTGKPAVASDKKLGSEQATTICQSPLAGHYNDKEEQTPLIDREGADKATERKQKVVFIIGPEEEEEEEQNCKSEVKPKAFV
ncbi:hypothetical protein CMQ_2085 [Grosmannia clavigera kw1407]|uniref:Uncharacterized protein n=1 Tax=Grosmannia clavigera (strain kw1407 / UAMH 11150) TaxID=655863 RepID=F0XJ81_GROCL|nr:uncharacterized protein CMQ_2085 [Grosmannia clavigera kw1407]EFX02036.1 hypothetical protein CMQ_2085 [Grosmannia clavigera kw1407]